MTTKGKPASCSSNFKVMPFPGSGARFRGSRFHRRILLTGGNEVKIGEFNGVTERLDLSRGHVIRWLGKYPPKDRTLQIFEHNQVNLTVYILLAATACLGIIMTVVFLVINIKFRNQRLVLVPAIPPRPRGTSRRLRPFFPETCPSHLTHLGRLHFRRRFFSFSRHIKQIRFNCTFPGEN